jgi:hypothetical protein
LLPTFTGYFYQSLWTFTGYFYQSIFTNLYRALLSIVTKLCRVFHQSIVTNLYRALLSIVTKLYRVFPSINQPLQRISINRYQPLQDISINKLLPTFTGYFYQSLPNFTGYFYQSIGRINPAVFIDAKKQHRAFRPVQSVLNNYLYTPCFDHSIVIRSTVEKPKNQSIRLKRLWDVTKYLMYKTHSINYSHILYIRHFVRSHKNVIFLPWILLTHCATNREGRGFDFRWCHWNFSLT